MAEKNFQKKETKKSPKKISVVKKLEKAHMKEGKEMKMLEKKSNKKDCY
jgi:hypothetical protein